MTGLDEFFDLEMEKKVIKYHIEPTEIGRIRLFNYETFLDIPPKKKRIIKKIVPKRKSRVTKHNVNILLKCRYDRAKISDVDKKWAVKMEKWLRKTNNDNN